MTALLRIPHGWIRRYLSNVERLFVAAALSGLLFGLIHNLDRALPSPAYPPYWDAVTVGLVLGVTLWSPALGYFLAVAAAAWSLSHLSLYLMAIFLAVALLAQRPVIHNLGAALLVLAAPWLGPLHLLWAVPLLGGLWWGAAGGALIGALGALWSQVIAGMAGLSPDLLSRFMDAPGAPAVVHTFLNAGSLQTLKLLVAPLAPDPTTLLYFLLQILLWAAVAGALGFIADRAWAQRRLPWSNVLLAWMAAFSLLLAHAGLSAWLQILPSPGLVALAPRLALAAALAACLASFLETLRDILEHPLPLPRSRASARPRRLTAPASDRAAPPASPSLDLPPAAKPASDSQETDPDDLIKLELD